MITSIVAYKRSITSSTGVEADCIADMQGVNHILHLI